MENYEIIFYDKPDGTEPAKEFLLSLDHKMRAKMLRTIDLKKNVPSVTVPNTSAERRTCHEQLS